MTIQFTPGFPAHRPAVNRTKAPQAAPRFGKVDEEGNWENKRFDKLVKSAGDKVKGGAAVAGGVAAFVYMPTIITVATGGLAPFVVGVPLLGYGAWKLGLIQKGFKALAKKMM